MEIHSSKHTLNKIVFTAIAGLVIEPLFNYDTETFNEINESNS